VRLLSSFLGCYPLQSLQGSLPILLQI